MDQIIKRVCHFGITSGSVWTEREDEMPLALCCSELFPAVAGRGTCRQPRFHCVTEETNAAAKANWFRAELTAGSKGVDVAETHAELLSNLTGGNRRSRAHLFPSTDD